MYIHTITHTCMYNIVQSHTHIYNHITPEKTHISSHICGAAPRPPARRFCRPRRVPPALGRGATTPPQNEVTFECCLAFLVVGWLVVGCCCSYFHHSFLIFLKDTKKNSKKNYQRLICNTSVPFLHPPVTRRYQIYSYIFKYHQYKPINLRTTIKAYQSHVVVSTHFKLVVILQYLGEATDNQLGHCLLRTGGLHRRLDQRAVGSLVGPDQ